jgi:hypothetical protein
MMRFRMIRGLLVIGAVAGFASGFASVHRHHEARRRAQMDDYCRARRDLPPPPPTAPPAAPAPR